MTTISPLSVYTIHPIAVLEPVGRIGQATAIGIGRMTEIHYSIAQRYLDMNAQRLLNAIEVRDAPTLNDYVHRYLEMLGDFSVGILKDAARLTDLGAQLHSDISQTVTDSFTALLHKEDSREATEAQSTISKTKPSETQDTQAAA